MDRIEKNLFKNTLGRPLSFLYPNGAELVHARTEFLKNLTAPNLPSSVIVDATAAISLSESGQSLCQLALDMAHITGPFASSLKSEILLLRASQKLDELTRKSRNEPWEPADELSREVRRKVVRILLANQDNNKSYADLIRDNFPEGELETNIAAMQANLLISLRNTLSATASMLPSIAELALVWRGLFYFSIIEAKGSKLQRELRRKQLKEALIKLCEAVPIGGNVLQASQAILEIGGILRGTEQKLKKLITDLAAIQVYLRKYILALTIWTDKIEAIMEVHSKFVDQLTETQHPEVI